MKAMNVNVRKATPDDAAGIVAVFNPIIEDGRYTAFDRPFAVHEERAYIEDLPARGFIHVAVSQDKNGDQGRIVGFQSVTPFDERMQAFAHVATIGTYVALDVQRQGIAALLFAASFREARKLGYEKFFTYVRADNEAGLAAYASQGFQVVGRAKGQAKVGGRHIDEIVIEKLL